MGKTSMKYFDRKRTQFYWKEMKLSYSANWLVDEPKMNKTKQKKRRPASIHPGKPIEIINVTKSLNHFCLQQTKKYNCGFMCAKEEEEEEKNSIIGHAAQWNCSKRSVITLFLLRFKKLWLYLFSFNELDDGHVYRARLNAPAIAMNAS